MKLQWYQPKKLNTSWYQNKIKIEEEWKERKKLGPLRVPKLQSFEPFFFSFP